MLVVVPKGRQILEREELKYLIKLGEYNNYLKNVGVSFKVDFRKRVSIENCGKVVEYSGLIWIAEDGSIVENVSSELCEELRPPPKWPFENARIIINDGDFLIDYRELVRIRRFLGDLEYKLLDESILDKAISILRENVKWLKEKVQKLLGIDMEWIPLKRYGILEKISERLGLSLEDAEDLIKIMAEKGVVEIRIGESGEIWVKSSSLFGGN